MAANGGSVCDFYANCSVFITGGTGFLGKVLIEKLLRSCRKIDKIYVLLRGTTNKTAQERLEDFSQEVLFEKVRKDDPNIMKKLIAVNGDLTLPNLGMSNEDYSLIVKNVSIVFHAAASVRFNLKIKEALHCNVEGTKKVIELCHKARCIKAFVHISTAYSNTDKTFVKEDVYPAPENIDKIYEIIRQNGDDTEADDLTSSRPNTYTYAKAVAEYEVLRNHGSVPTAIIRPSIVTPIWRDPIPGWLDKWTGGTPIIFGLCKGLLRCLDTKPSNVIDFIPADIAVNLSILAAAKCHVDTPKVKVYNCCSGPTNPMSFRMLTDNCQEITIKHGLYWFPYPKIFFSTNRVFLKIFRLVFQLLPLFLADVWLKMRGKHPRYVKILEKLTKVEKALHFFIKNQWQFENHNVEALISTLSPSDRVQFPCDPSEICWKTHFEDYCLGIDKYLMNTSTKSANINSGMY